MEQSYANQSFEGYRTAFAPAHQFQQEGLKALGRIARFQCTIAGDLLEHNLAGVQAMVSAANPAEYLAKQGQLTVRLAEKVATHTREFLNEAMDQSVAETEPASSIETAPPSEMTLQPEEEESIDDVEEERKAADLMEHDLSDDELADESIEPEPDELSVPKASMIRQGKKRSDKSRRRRTHS